MADAAAVRRLAPPPVLRRPFSPLALQWIGGLAAGLIAALLGAGWLQRQVRHRTLALAQVNHALEAEMSVREKAQTDLAAALKDEQEVGAMKSRFVSTVSHEFRTPLGVIMSATDMLDRYRDRLPPERMAEHLTEIRTATRHMSDMMEDILFLGRAEGGKVLASPHEVDLEEFCHRLADETRSAVSQTGQTVITCEALPGPARMDEMLFRHMFSNLLSNAVKYSPEGAEIRVHLKADGPRAIVTITDQGIGIPESDAARLFEPFSRGSNVGARQGTGLGLVVVRRCAELSGGAVTFTSQPGQGTTFTITVPVWS